MPKTTPLESWIARKIGVSDGELTRESIAEYQLRKLRETLDWARSHSPFYSRRLRKVSEGTPGSFAAFERVPFTNATDLQEHGLQFLCVSQGDIDRVVTLESSGTSGVPKRVFLTTADHESTIDFFRVGMSQLLKNGQSVLIALPFERPGSVGELLATTVRQLGVRPILCGRITEPGQAIEMMKREQVECVIGVPVEILSLVRTGGRDVPSRFLNNVLLCSDHVSDSIVRAIRKKWGCEVFEHYGMTEMGLGGGVDCEAHAGYHLREADLYFEIVDPESGLLCQPGAIGEVVVTTLTRQGMPFIRYRTGDLSRFLPDRCACGTVLRRMDRVCARKSGRVAVGAHTEITIATLDEALFCLPEVEDFSASIDSGRPSKLIVTVYGSGAKEDLQEQARAVLERVPEIDVAEKTGELHVIVNAVERRASTFTGKRRIEQRVA
ncbi:MAG TPA: AMP-binding protein [Terriglobales bacterium]|nr:AMP-binding protein [Terriglobales bacterium]